jgi:hypothetical protein
VGLNFTPSDLIGFMESIRWFSVACDCAAGEGMMDLRPLP